MKSAFAVAILRILLSPVFFFAFIWDFTEIAIVLYFAAFVSDIADGFIARRQGITSSSPTESYLDPIADFVMVLVSFYAFSLKQMYSSLILPMFALMFLFFVFTSNREQPLYDPVGKYYGTFLMVMIGVTLILPLKPVINAILILIIVYSIGLIIYRSGYLLNRRKANEVLGLDNKMKFMRLV